MIKFCFNTFFITILFFCNLQAQVKERSSSSYPYAGIGYSFVIFTDSKVSDIYPFLDFNNNSFLSEINPFFGVRINEKVAVELSPSFVFTTAHSNKGFAFTQNNQTLYYLPSETSLFSLPINFNVKVFPFTADMLSFVSNIYFTGGGGPIYIKEKYTNYRYTNSNFTGFVDIQTAENSMWKAHYSMGVGYGSLSRFGYNFEVSYRLVPLSPDNQKPVVSSLANNFNSVNLSARITFNF